MAQDKYQPGKDHIITAASCTTNCLGPVVKVMLDKFGIIHGCITTVHNVTNTQTIVDAPNTKKTDLRRARYGFHLMPLLVASSYMSSCIAIESGLLLRWRIRLAFAVQVRFGYLINDARQNKRHSLMAQVLSPFATLASGECGQGHAVVLLCRSGLVNLAPTSTGSATAIASIFPELRGKLNGKIP